MSLGANVAFCAFFYDYHLVVYAYSAQPTYFLWHTFKSIACAVNAEPFSFITKAGVTQAPLPPTLTFLANHTHLPWGLAMF